jgi:hypothetical protein
MKKLTDAILRGDKQAQNMINRMIEEVKEYLRNRPEDDEEEEDDWDSDMSWLDDEG